MSKQYKAIAGYYDAEYAHLEYLERDVPFLLSKMGRKKQRVLELATGTGRAAIPMAQSGHAVVGVDYDGEMLEIAGRKAGFVGLGKEVRWEKGDMRKVRVRGGKGGFDWCVILFNTLLAMPTLEAIDEVMETCRWHLRKGGKLWVDIFNPDLGLLAEGQSWGLDPVTFYVPELDRTVSRVSDLEDVGGSWSQVRRVTFHYRWFEGGEERTKSVGFEMTWMMPREVRMLMERHGFAVREMWGDYDGGELGAGSPRIVAVGERW